MLHTHEPADPGIGPGLAFGDEVHDLGIARQQCKCFEVRKLPGLQKKPRCLVDNHAAPPNLYVQLLFLEIGEQNGRCNRLSSRRSRVRCGLKRPSPLSPLLFHKSDPGGPGAGGCNCWTPASSAVTAALVAALGSKTVNTTPAAERAEACQEKMRHIADYRQGAR